MASDAVFLERALVEALNAAVRARGARKADTLRAIKDFKRGIYLLQWENKYKDMEVGWDVAGCFEKRLAMERCISLLSNGYERRLLAVHSAQACMELMALHESACVDTQHQCQCLRLPPATLVSEAV